MKHLKNKINNIYTIIKLIINEIIKVGIYKLVITDLIFLIVILLIYKNNKNNILSTSYTLIPFIGIFIIVFFGGTISSEIEHGSIKCYLTKPILRWKIYLSKLLTIYLYIVLIVSYIIFIYSIVINKIDIDFIAKYYEYSIPLLLIGTISLFISTTIKNTALCIGIDLFILVFSSLISQILFGIEFNIIEYTFLPYLDFSIFNNMESIKEMNSELGINLNINRGIIIDIVYTILFYYIGKYIFICKDIKN